MPFIILYDFEFRLIAIILYLKKINNTLTYEK